MTTTFLVTARSWFYYFTIDADKCRLSMVWSYGMAPPPGSAATLDSQLRNMGWHIPQHAKWNIIWGQAYCPTAHIAVRQTVLA